VWAAAGRLTAQFDQLETMTTELHSAEVYVYVCIRYTCTCRPGYSTLQVLGLKSTGCLTPACSSVQSGVRGVERPQAAHANLPVVAKSKQLDDEAWQCVLRLIVYEHAVYMIG
jgi:hypothetical protein